MFDSGKAASSDGGADLKWPKKLSPDLIAPCGICCHVCYVFLRQRNPCGGCRDASGNQPNHCRQCKIRDCVDARGLTGCFECDSMPCPLITRLDRSYRQRYQVSLIDNLNTLATTGAKSFLSVEKERWVCTACGGVVSLHDRECSECGSPSGE